MLNSATQTTKQAPLPFTGQKRMFLKHFTQILNQHIPDDGAGWIIVDVFGGSGLLAHTAKHVKPAARVIYNDFDDYSARLRRIGDTNRLRRCLLDIVKDIPRLGRLPPDMQHKVISTVQNFDGFIDLGCLQSWLLFSSQQVGSLEALYKKQMYQCVRLSDYQNADGYLDGLDITAESYRSLLPRYENQEKTLLVLDPPYVCTSQGAYRMNGYFGMVEFLRLMAMVRPPFVFFSSTRSELPDYLELVVEQKLAGWQRLCNYKTIAITSTLNKNCQYEDNLIYRF